MGDDDPRGLANLDPRGMIGRIYVGHHYKPMADNDAPGAWPIWTPGSRLAGIIKGLTKHCFTQNIKVWASWFQKRNSFYVFSYYKSMEANDLPGCGQLGPQGHDWQDL